MSPLAEKVVKNLTSENKIPILPKGLNLPLPVINKVELYLSFNCNDMCQHCITNSGPGNIVSLHPDTVDTVITNISKYTIIEKLKQITGGGAYSCTYPKAFKNLENQKKPVKKLEDLLKIQYSDNLQGKKQKSEWIINDQKILLNFGKPSIRLSGGEFFMWPRFLDGKKLSDNERLVFQKQLLHTIRQKIPEYDIWILTNGRFAESDEVTNKVITHWADQNETYKIQGKTRLSISVDLFHQPPKGSTIKDMLKRIWSACKEYNMSAPFLYGIPNNRIELLGRAFKNFSAGKINASDVKNSSKSNINPVSDILADPIDLVSQDGCNEVKGFSFNLNNQNVFANNIVISPEGRMVFCCACLGDYGSFIDEPELCLKNLMTHPVSLMLRKSETAALLLNTAAKIDPSIKIFGSGEHPAVTGSTCYQMMTGERISL